MGYGVQCYFCIAKIPRVENFEKLFRKERHMETIIGAFAVGLLVGCIFTIVAVRLRSIGALRVDTSEPTGKPLLFLELWTPAEKVKNHKYATLKVTIKGDMSQK
jgi:hypothetical protein